MASISEMQTTKDGRRYWLIRVSMGKGQSFRKTRFYFPEGSNGRPISEARALSALNKFANEFESKCKSGEVLSRQQIKDKEAAEKAERAKLRTVREYSENIFMPTKMVSVTENTRNNYQMFLDRHIYPIIGDELLIDVTPAMLQKVIVDYQKTGCSHASAVKLFNILSGIFKMAFLDDSIPISPMLKVQRPKLSKDAVSKPEADKALTVQEINYVFSCIDSEYNEALQNFENGYDKQRVKVYSAMLWKAYILLSADTGARRGEMCGLQWADIDWKKKTITISRNLSYTPSAGTYIGTTKNGKNRVVDIGDSTIDFLKTLKAEQTKKADKLAKEHNAPVILPVWVFTQDGTNDPIHPQSPTRFFKKFGERYNIPDFHPHLLRHTAASIAITHGADVASVSARLGHSDTAVTLRMYTHANEESIRAAGQTLRDAITADSKKDQKEEKAEG